MADPCPISFCNCSDPIAAKSCPINDLVVHLLLPRELELFDVCRILLAHRQLTLCNFATILSILSFFISSCLIFYCHFSLLLLSLITGIPFSFLFHNLALATILSFLSYIFSCNLWLPFSFLFQHHQLTLSLSLLPQSLLKR